MMCPARPWGRRGMAVVIVPGYGGMHGALGEGCFGTTVRSGMQSTTCLTHRFTPSACMPLVPNDMA